ncbi:N(4)-(Beta-N-acetylglucosaminyl)-L-asparaginase-like [Watersipora subatra]|uniref:N(4)-(Beta-N-acetylglucosaminyl)-L-asparaginase- like n=1 Tax=Watersipora subatra TaxID=2589382 RepID=UPI00355B8313
MPPPMDRFTAICCHLFLLSWAVTCELCSAEFSKNLNTNEIVVNTWAFRTATETGWNALVKGGSALDAVESGCSQCEVDQCDGTVGYGGSPDENGETTLDAMIMDGVTHDVGAVGGLRRVKEAMSVARAVLTYTTHTLLVGESATRFAVEMGFNETDLSTNKSRQLEKEWKENNCQPNYRQNVSPDSRTSCGPYTPIHHEEGCTWRTAQVTQYNHDTIGMIAIDNQGHIAAGTSTNGLNHKVPGRVGDSPIAGAGAYAEQGVGGAAATGDGDVMMRLLPTYHTVTLMSMGKAPSEAASIALAKVVKFYPNFDGAIVATTMNGTLGAACHGFDAFPFSYRTAKDAQVETVTLNCTQSPDIPVPRP